MNPEVQAIINGERSDLNYYGLFLSPLLDEQGTPILNEQGEFTYSERTGNWHDWVACEKLIGKNSDLSTFESHETDPLFIGWLNESPTGNYLLNV